MRGQPPDFRPLGQTPGLDALVTKTNNPVLRALRADALDILRNALERVDPAQAVMEALQVQEGVLVVSGTPVPMAAGRRVQILAIGKGSARMAEGARRVLRPASGLLVTPDLVRSPPEGFDVIRASHPLPDSGSLAAGASALKLVGRLRPEDVLLVLLSGGASALFESSPVPLQDLRTACAELLRSGLGIREVNEVRKGLSDVKGGRLAERALARGARVIGLILSDIVGNPIEDIGSGPTALRSSRGERGRAVLRAHGHWDSMPTSVRQRLSAVAREKRRKAPLRRGLHNVIVADNSRACEAACREAERRGYAARVLATSLEGEARRVGPSVASIALRRSPHSSSIAVIAGGETTVKVRGKGRGGRNQELALSATEVLEGQDAVLLACGTDGADGNTEAAGAIVDGETMARARSLGLKPRDFLDRNDSYAFFGALDDLVVTGPTGTNVADLVIVLARRSRQSATGAVSRSARTPGRSGTRRSPLRGRPARRSGGRR